MSNFLNRFGGCLVTLGLVVSSLGCSDEATSTSGSGSSSSSGGSTVEPGSVVINEIQATVEDWVEIKNIGTEVADLTGHGLADKMADGTPEVADAVRFVDGEKLAPGEYLLVVVNVKGALAGPQSQCLMSGGPTRCYQAKWGVSSTNGDSIFLLYPDDRILDLATYPMNAVPMDQSYCRLPDGTGKLVACKSTPGATNSAP